MLTIPENAYTEKLWRCVTGEFVSVSTMSDERIANTFKFINHYYDNCCLALGCKYTDTILDELKIQILNRGITQAFLAAAPYPYQDKTAKWFVWSFKHNKDVPYKKEK
jgi:hypothetical protein